MYIVSLLSCWGSTGLGSFPLLLFRIKEHLLVCAISSSTQMLRYIRVLQFLIRLNEIVASVLCSLSSLVEQLDWYKETILLPLLIYCSTDIAQRPLNWYGK